MYNFHTNSYNGVEVAYATLPMYMLNLVNQDASLNSSEKLVFIRLMAYASAKNSTSFGITAQWVADNTGLNRNTASRALTNLRKAGYVDEDGIVYQAPPETAQRATNPRKPRINERPTTKAVVSSVYVEQKPVTPITPATVVDSVGAFAVAETMAKTTETVETSNIDDINEMFRKMGIRKTFTQDSLTRTEATPKQEEPAQEEAEIMPQTVAEPAQKQAEPMPHFEQTMPHFVASMPQTIASHITIPHKQSKNNTPTADADVGVLSDSAFVGFVGMQVPTQTTNARRSNRAMSMAEVIAGKPKSLNYQQEAYIETALKRMNVTSAMERERYLSEIGYAVTKGSYHATYQDAPLKAIRACLNLVERGNWRHPAGMYA